MSPDIFYILIRGGYLSIGMIRLYDMGLEPANLSRFVIVSPALRYPALAALVHGLIIPGA